MAARSGLVGAVALLILALAPAGQGRAQAPADNAVHLGVASCSGGNCHGATQRSKGSYVPQNEYLIWSKRDKHRLAYRVLSEPRSRRIARNLGIADPTTAPLCLNCHADNVPPNRRGPQFQIADGVGCEACHGGASTWLGVHIAGGTHQQNLAAGLYPTKNPATRAEKCLSCHFGNPADPQRFVTHQIMGAGHPRMGFELDTYTLAEPAHFVVDKTYVQRKGPVSDARVWAVGQAVSLLVRNRALLTPTLAPRGLFPELVLFDCQACHHAFDWQRSEPPAVTGLPTGWPPLDDSNGVMLRLVAARVAPASAPALGRDVFALRRATTQGWPVVTRQAGQLRQVADGMLPLVENHAFTPEDIKVLATAVIALSLSPRGSEFSVAEQATMALASLESALKMSGSLNPRQEAAMNKALAGLYGAFASEEEAYRRASFVKALQELRTAAR
ncbi:MAG TPA: multiheme c-type cytochrome [Stellaceae bacterium]|nr:multiheme c-type cytochrome [Stellaceae bacterium]